MNPSFTPRAHLTIARDILHGVGRLKDELGAARTTVASYVLTRPHLLSFPLRHLGVLLYFSALAFGLLWDPMIMRPLVEHIVTDIAQLEGADVNAITRRFVMGQIGLIAMTSWLAHSRRDAAWMRWLGWATALGIPLMALAVGWETVVVGRELSTLNLSSAGTSNATIGLLGLTLWSVTAGAIVFYVGRDLPQGAVELAEAVRYIWLKSAGRSAASAPEAATANADGHITEAARLAAEYLDRESMYVLEASDLADQAIEDRITALGLTAEFARLTTRPGGPPPGGGGAPGATSSTTAH